MSLSDSERVAIGAAIEKIRVRYLCAASKLASAVMENGKIDPNPVRTLRATLDELEKALEASAGAWLSTPPPTAQPTALAERLKSLDAMLDEERSESETLCPSKGATRLSPIGPLKGELSDAVKQKSEAPPAKSAISEHQPKPQPAAPPRNEAAIPLLEQIVTVIGDGLDVDEPERPADARARSAEAVEGAVVEASEAAPAPSVGEADRGRRLDDDESPTPPKHIDPNDAVYSILRPQTKIGEVAIFKVDRNGNILTELDSLL